MKRCLALGISDVKEPSIAKVAFLKKEKLFFARLMDVKSNVRSHKNERHRSTNETSVVENEKTKKTLLIFL
jgi:hypothetical protein